MSRQRSCLVACCLLLVTAPSTRAKDAFVQIDGVNHARPDAAPLYEVTFKYDFPDNQEVAIPGIGVVKGSGQINKYLTTSKELEFRDPTKRVLLMKKLVGVNFTTTKSGDQSQPPNENEFPQSFRTGKIGSNPFATRVLAVIQQFFPGGFSSFESGQIAHYTSTYQILPIVSVTNRAEVAVHVTQPHNEAGTDRFRLRYIVRDRPRLSNTWRYGDDRSQEAVDAGTKFVNVVVGALETVGQN
jgi:hypothetical protein